MAKYGSEQILPYNNEEHKTTQVRRMFDSIAGTYDQLNHTLSLGIDKIWRRKGIAFLRPFSPASILDIATGTGDLAISMYRRLKADRIIGADISEGMMEVGRQKVAEAGLSDHITFEYQDCTALTYPDNSFDWHHPDFPKYNDCNHPMRGDPAYQDEKIDFDRYLAYMHGQIEELVTNYGRIDILWFDYAYDELRGEAWRATDLIRMVRRHQPDVIIDNRLETSGEGFGSLVTEQPAYYSGDFVSPEQILPPEGIRNVRGERVPWELCTTMNNNWGYSPYDTDYKPASMLIRKLVECVSKGGNMILNVGPDANGRFNLESCRLLDEIGTWLAVNGESIYGCGSADVPKPDWGWYTKKDGRIYAHILENPIGPLALTGLDAKRVGAVRRLADGSEVLRGESWITNAYENLAFVTLGTIPHFTYLLSDPADTVLEIEYKEACL